MRLFFVELDEDQPHEKGKTIQSWLVARELATVTALGRDTEAGRGVESFPGEKRGLRVPDGGWGPQGTWLPEKRATQVTGQGQVGPSGV